MSFIDRFLGCFGAQPTKQLDIVDHGDPDACFLGPPVMMGGRVVKPAPRLPEGASRIAANGERIDSRANRKALCLVAPREFWEEIEANGSR